MEYKVIHSENLLDINEIVNEMLMDGWIPQGGISVVQTAVGTEFYQSLVKII